VVMLVDYQHSNAGPYRELLFVPGQFQVGGRRFYSITKIYVSTPQSVTNGRRNWGIPKELADFELTRRASGLERLHVVRQGQVVAEFELRPRGWGLPVTTAVIPSALRTIIELLDRRTYLTTPNGRGRLHPARLERVSSNPQLFPDIGQFRPRLCLRASNFALQFPVAEITESPGSEER